ncbi:MAG: serine/threonine protein kinase [Polyangiaceae bacterium]|nr:serine/threonine protein kinase [Polyangiaceae bacterium]
MTGIDDDLGGMPTNPAPATVIPVGVGLFPGHVLAGRYEIVAKLGHGGMGAVFRAHDRELGEDVALKVILPERVRDPGVLDRFRREVKLARKIAHPNVCRVFDMGEEGNLRFLTMEFIAGKSLRELLANGPLEPTRALVILHQIIEGVAAAHAQGVVHRDLKPDNVMIRDGGQAVVADFGLARTPTGNTAASNFAGTPAYMSPEQLRGEPLDARSDIFALGIVAYEMLTGRLPFTGASLGAIAAATLRDAPAPFELSTLSDSMQRGIKTAILRALEKKPADRFASCMEFGEALASAGVTHSAETLMDAAPLARVTETRYARVAAVGIVAALALGILIWRPWSAIIHAQQAPAASAHVGIPSARANEQPALNAKHSTDEAGHEPAHSEVDTRAALAILEGDFDSAVQVLEERRNRAVADDDPASYVVSSTQLALTYLEMGLPKKADDIAADFFARKEAKLEKFSNDWAMLLAVRIRAGGMTAEEFAKERIAWIDRIRGKQPTNGPRDELDWLDWSLAYGFSVESRAEAIEALEKMPRTHEPKVEFGRLGTDLVEGKVYVLAEQFDKAVEPLTRAAAPGNALEAPLVPTRARFYLGMALQGKGDEAGARRAFERVIDRWGKAKPRSMTAERAREALKKMGASDKHVAKPTVKPTNPFGTAIETRR